MSTGQGRVLRARSLSHARHPFHPRQSPRRSTKASRNRGMEPLSAQLIALDDRRKGAISALQAATERRNALSKEIGQAKAKKDEARAQELMAEVARAQGKRCRSSKQAERVAEKALFDALSRPFPNLPKDDVPVGADEHGNVERHRFGNADEPRQRQAAFRDRRSSRPDGFRDGGEALGLALRGAERRARAAGAGARPVHDRPAHERARLHGSDPAAAGARRRDVRHGATAEIRGRPVLGLPRQRARAGRRRMRSRGAAARCHRAR